MGDNNWDNFTTMVWTMQQEKERRLINKLLTIHWTYGQHKHKTLERSLNSNQGHLYALSGLLQVKVNEYQAKVL